MKTFYYVRTSSRKRGRLFRYKTENSPRLIINQPKATNGIKPSFEAFFTVRALTDKSRAVNNLHDSIKHKTANLDYRALNNMPNESN